MTQIKITINVVATITDKRKWKAINDFMVLLLFNCVVARR